MSVWDQYSGSAELQDILDYLALQGVGQPVQGDDGNNILEGFNLTSFLVQHNFSNGYVVPDLPERQHIDKLDPSPTRGISQGDLSVSYTTKVTMSFVETNAGYKNSLGHYIVDENGVIKGVSLDFKNVKDVKPGTEVTFDVPGNDSGQLGFFIIADGFSKNNSFKALTAGKRDGDGEYQFVYNLGKKDERPATIHDDAKDISLVYVDGKKTTVIKGDIYHTTAEDGSNAINPDNQVHVISGLAHDGDPDVLRIGFEDLKHQGDADFNDVIFDVRVQPLSIGLPDTLLNDVIYGGAGDDVIYGYDGHDKLYGEAGNDTIYGGNGKDHIYGGDGADTLDGGANEDLIYGGDKNDVIDGGDGHDVLYGEAGNDIVRGGNGNDILDGGSGNDFLYGGDGTDQLFGGIGNDYIYGDGGDDHLYGDDGDDALYGGAGHDVIDGGNGNDIITGDDGDDVINGGAGQDTLYGANGDDIIDGGADNDRLYGNAGNDTLIGGAGNDILYGYEDNDILIGGAGEDTLWGMSGADTFKFVVEDLDGTINRIRDFRLSEGDKLDISDILIGYEHGVSDINDFIVFHGPNAAGDVSISFDRDGAGSEYSSVFIAKLSAPQVPMDAQTLLDDGTLIVH